MESMYDVAVVGAGPGGSAAAHYLAASGLKVLLLDKSDFPRDKTCGDGITPRGLHVLADMGILDEAGRAGYRINGIKLYSERGTIMSGGVPDHPVYPNHLLVVPRLKLDDLIRKKAVKSGVYFESPVRVLGLRVGNESVTIRADRGGSPLEYKARVIILAIGANMRLLQDIGLLKSLPRTIAAVRTYYEGMQGIDDYIQGDFKDVPNPGYGWVFPIAKDAANVGLGMWRDIAHDQGSLRSALDVFVNSPRLKAMLAGARQVGPIKSYPLRIDFTTAPTFGERVLLVGETAGLVSPLTGEGIDFALESGKLAAEFLAGIFAHGDFSKLSLSAYDRLLRANFQNVFRALGYLRHVYVNPLLMDRVFKICEKIPEVKQIFVSVLLSQERPTRMLHPRFLRQVLFGV